MSDHVTLSNVYGAMGNAQRKAEWAAKRLMARHLRVEHGWGIRRINRELEMTDAEVRRACDDEVTQ